MISVNTVRNTIMFLLNKANKGYLGVDEFNSFGQLAQLAIFEDLFDQYNRFINKENKRLTGSNYADLPQNLREQIDVFAEYTTQVNFTYNLSSNLWSYTGSDLYRAENLALINSASGKKIDIQEVNKQKLNKLNNSNLTAPSLLFPICERIGSSFRIYPNVPSGSYAELFYLRTPKNPKWTYMLVQGNPQYNGSAPDKQDFELHPSLFNTLIVKILGYAGLSIREQEVESIANSEEMKSYQKLNS